jgi:hypothetical protein
MKLPAGRVPGEGPFPFFVGGDTDRALLKARLTGRMRELHRIVLRFQIVPTDTTHH